MPTAAPGGASGDGDPTWLQVVVGGVTDLPEGFRTFGVDGKGLTSPEAAHPFTYELRCTLRGASAEPPPSADTDPPPESECGVYTFAGGSYHPVLGDEFVSDEPTGNADSPDWLGPHNITDLRGKAAILWVSESRGEGVPAAPEGAGPPKPSPAAVGCRLPLTADVLQQLREPPANGALPLLEFRLRRVPGPSIPSDVVDANDGRYRAVARVPLPGPLQHPGRTSLRFAVPLMPDPDPNGAPPGARQRGARVPPRRRRPGVPLTLTVEEDPAVPSPYLEAGTRLVGSLWLDRPLVPPPHQRNRPPFRPADLLPKRVRPPLRPLDADRLFSEEVRALALSLAEQWADAGRADPPSGGAAGLLAFPSEGTDGAARRAARERLRPLAAAVAKEKFAGRGDLSALGAATELQTALYGHLVGIMHRTLTDLSHAETPLEPWRPEGEEPGTRLLRLAEEAEEEGDPDRAALCHRRRVAAAAEACDDPALAGAWHDAALQALRSRDPTAAEGAFREALAVDAAFRPSLLAYGLLLLSLHRLPEAEVYIQAAVDVAIGDPLGWASLRLFMEVAGEAAVDEPVVRRQRRQEAAYAAAQARSLLAAEGAGGGGEDSDLALSLRVAAFLLDLRLEPLAGRLLTDEVQPPGATSTGCLLLRGRLCLQAGATDAAATALRQVLHAHPAHRAAARLLGDALSAAGRTQEAADTYLRALAGGGGDGRVRARLGRTQLVLGEYGDARDTFLWAAKEWPCGLTWRGLGTAYYHLGDFVEAERALSEGNLLDPEDGGTWGYLALVHVAAGRRDVARFARRQAARRGLKDNGLAATLDAAFQAAGWPDAEDGAHGAAGA